VSLARAVVVHGHFYQPPRESPWLEAVEVQDSAAPYHDWNERVTAECYAPNTAARRQDDGNRIIDVVNNFEKISFNVGPTLAAWLERHASDTYAKIVAADRASVRAHGGHGNAVAQVYNHMIMPLATRRDKTTQVRWGLADFRARFGREPEGMWLPEMAVDTDTLAVLAEEGLRFTILTPAQARRVRGPDEDAWRDVPGGVDPRRPYRWRGTTGAELALFFCDGPISHAIAFEGLLQQGDQFAARLCSAFVDGDSRPQLVHAATDGESYGHHSRFGEMALAAAVRILEADGGVRLANYGAFLAAHPPGDEAQIKEATSWSCPHGVERWRSDCGCRIRADAHQRWRGPLREALDWLRDQIDPFYEAQGASFLKDPWEARDAYVQVILDRRPATVEEFLARQQAAPLDAAGRLHTLRLLEMQRHRLLMYTSCGWFFDEISALEPVQILRYAAMAMQYLRDLGGNLLEDEFVRRLEAAPSNVPSLGHGGEVYRRLIKPAVVDLHRVVAHYAITAVVEPPARETGVYAYRVERLDNARETYGGTALEVAHVRVGSEITGETREAMYAALHFGGHDFACGIRAWEGAARYDRMKEDLVRRYGRFALADVVRGMDEHFTGDTYSLTDLFIEERRRVLSSVTAAVLERHEAAYLHIWEENRRLMRYLRQADAPIPDALALAARHVLEQQILAELATARVTGTIPDRAFELAGEAQALGLTLNLLRGREPLQLAVGVALDEVAAEPEPTRVARALALIEGAERLNIGFGHWRAQNRFFDIWRARGDTRTTLAPLARALGFNLPIDAGAQPL